MLCYSFPSFSQEKVLFFQTDWGFDGSIEEFIKKAKDSGYDGIETWAPIENDKKQKLISSSLPFEELGWIDDENVTFSSVSEEDGSKQYVLKIDDKTTVFFDAETGLKTKQVTMAATPEGSISPQPTIYEEYRDVDGILFPHLIKIPLGPQTLEFNTKEIQLNPAISDSDFN